MPNFQQYSLTFFGILVPYSLSSFFPFELLFVTKPVVALLVKYAVGWYWQKTLTTALSHTVNRDASQVSPSPDSCAISPSLQIHFFHFAANITKLNHDVYVKKLIFLLHYLLYAYNAKIFPWRSAFADGRHICLQLLCCD